MEQAPEVPRPGPESLFGVGDHSGAVHHALQPHGNVSERLEPFERMAEEKNPLCIGAAKNV